MTPSATLLSSLFTRIDDIIRQLLKYPVHTRILGASRTILAVGSVLTLIGTPTDQLFYVSTAIPEGRLCKGINDAVGLYCVVPASTSALTAAKWIAIAILLAVASGWRPRITAIPHWWICFSFSNSSNAIDGGDQVATILTLLLIPICLTDPRKWHWNRVEAKLGSGAVIAGIALRLIWLQTFVIYLQASMAKLSVTEWQNGTNFWYWATTEPFGLAGPLKPIGSWALQFPLVVVAITWGAVAVEFYLAICIFNSQPWRRWGLLLGWSLHAGIAITLGLISFSLTMSALLLLTLRRPQDGGTLVPPLMGRIGSRTVRTMGHRRSRGGDEHPSVPQRVHVEVMSGKGIDKEGSS